VGPKTFAPLDDKDREELIAQYKPDKILAIYDALTWAIAHPDFGFLHEYAKAIPQKPPTTHDSATIVEYFKKLRDGMAPVVEKLRPTTK
jgi:hypothetical protein